MSTPTNPLYPELPVPLKLAIADCVTLFSCIEACAVEIVWRLKEADLDEMKRIAKDAAANTLDTVKEALKLVPGAEAGATWAEAANLRQERNLIAHGVWRVDREGMPHVSWHSKFLESADRIVFAHFPYERFDYFLHQGRIVLATLTNFLDTLKATLPRRP